MVWLDWLIDLLEFFGSGKIYWKKALVRGKKKFNLYESLEIEFGTSYAKWGILNYGTGMKNMIYFEQSYNFLSLTESFSFLTY